MFEKVQPAQTVWAVSNMCQNVECNDTITQRDYMTEIWEKIWRMKWEGPKYILSEPQKEKNRKNREKAMIKEIMTIKFTELMKKHKSRNPNGTVYLKKEK